MNVLQNVAYTETGGHESSAKSDEGRLEVTFSHSRTKAVTTAKVPIPSNYLGRVILLVRLPHLSFLLAKKSTVH